MEDFIDLPTEDEASPEATPHRRRRRTLYDYIIAAGALAGAVFTISALAAWASDKTPYVKKIEVEALAARVGRVENSLGGLQLNQLMSLELQLTDRVQKLGDEIGKMGPNGITIYDTRHEQNEAQQRLESVRAQIVKIQGSSSPQP